VDELLLEEQQRPEHDHRPLYVPVFMWIHHFSDSDRQFIGTALNPQFFWNSDLQFFEFEWFFWIGIHCFTDSDLSSFRLRSTDFSDSIQNFSGFEF
jgi:hypothetical protein